MQGKTLKLYMLFSQHLLSLFLEAPKQPARPRRVRVPAGELQGGPCGLSLARLQKEAGHRVTLGKADGSGELVPKGPVNWVRRQSVRRDLGMGAGNESWVGGMTG